MLKHKYSVKLWTKVTLIGGLICCAANLFSGSVLEREQCFLRNCDDTYRATDARKSLTSCCKRLVETPVVMNRTDIYAFYYPWYENPSGGTWRHWNANARLQGGSYEPEQGDIASPFYPMLGAYSSSNLDLITTHMEWMNRAGIGVVVVSWWGVNSDEEQQMPTILEAANLAGLKVAIYIEPYKGGYVGGDSPGGTRTPYTARDDVVYLIRTYGFHSAYHHINGRPVFMFFAARSYMNGRQDEWKIVWDELHSQSLYNPVVIAHDTNLDERILAGGWDGGHEYGCIGAEAASVQWQQLAQRYQEAGKFLYFQICPGFDKSRYRTGESLSVVPREDGQLYQRLWQRAMEAKKHGTTRVVIVTFNEWHEGTSIEPAIPYVHAAYETIIDNINVTVSEYTYNDYEGAFGLLGDQASFSYLDQTKVFSDKYLAAADSPSSGAPSSHGMLM